MKPAGPWRPLGHSQDRWAHMHRRAMYQSVSPVQTGRAADHLLPIAEPIVCKEANILDASSFPCPPTLTFSKLREIERPWHAQHPEDRAEASDHTHTHQTSRA